MKSGLNSHLALLIAASLLLASCSNSGTTYWIPPPIPEATQPALAGLSPGVNPPGSGPTQAATRSAEELNPAVEVAQMATPLPTETSLPTETAQPTPEPGGSEPGGSEPGASPTPEFSTAPGAPPGVNSAPQIEGAPVLYYAQAADTLPVVAVRFGVDPSEIESPDPIPETGFISPGQLLVIPDRLGETTASQQLMPDSEIVFSPSAADFDMDAFLAEAGGRLNTYQTWLKSTGNTPGGDIVMRVAVENSINPRLLLSLLEYQSGWVYGQPLDAQQDRFPLGLVDNSHAGLFNQLVWAVNQLSIGYYAYREGRMTEIHFPDGSTARMAPDLNAGTAAIQYYFAQIYNQEQWLQALDPNTGFPALHAQMFGDFWARAATVEPLFPSGITQPPLILPFVRNWKWSLTGGPHGAWEHDGAYSAIDFAPGSTEPGCVKSTAWVLAAASGLVTRSGGGVVALDLDGDGREQTGWVLVYLHVSSEQRVPVGQWVDLEDHLGHPSCEGGVSTGTHLHIARKYNGEWIPADGPLPFNLGGWVAHAGEQAYKGSLTRGDETVTASTSSAGYSHLVRTDEDP